MAQAIPQAMAPAAAGAAAPAAASFTSRAYAVAKPIIDFVGTCFSSCGRFISNHKFAVGVVLALAVLAIVANQVDWSNFGIDAASQDANARRRDGGAANPRPARTAPTADGAGAAAAAAADDDADAPPTAGPIRGERKGAPRDEQALDDPRVKK